MVGVCQRACGGRGQLAGVCPLLSPTCCHRHVGLFMCQGFKKSKLASCSLHSQDDLELPILLCLPSTYWDYRHGPPYQGCTVLVIEPRVSAC